MVFCVFEVSSSALSGKWFTSLSGLLRCLTPCRAAHTLRAAFSPFRLSHHVFRHLIRSGWELSRRPTTSDESTGLQSVDFFFCRASPGATRLVFAMGQCSPTLIKAISSSESSSVDLSRHWASFWVSPTETPLAENPPPHNCLQDHISEWPGGRKLFGGSQGGYALPMVVCFTPCPRNPDKTMVLSAANFGRRHRFGASWFSRDALLNSGRIDSR